LIGPLYCFGPPLRFALGYGERIRTRKGSGAKARRRDYFRKRAAKALAMRQQLSVSIGQGKGVLSFPPFGLAYGARCHPVAAIPLAAKRQGQTFCIVIHGPPLS
jgi:hypothetical protein